MTINLDLEKLSLYGPVDSGRASLESFERGDLLVRGMPASDVIVWGSENLQKFSFKSWDRELELMQDIAGIKGLSATLLRKDCFVDTYTNSGLLFDASQVEITDIFKGDAGTSVTEDEVLGDDGLRCENLDILKEFIDQHPTGDLQHSYNEVKINAKLKSIAGLFYVYSAKSMSSDHQAYSKLQMAVWKKHILEKFHLDLPVFQYEREGKLTEIDMAEKVLAKQLPRKISSASGLAEGYILLRNYVFPEKKSATF